MLLKAQYQLSQRIRLLFCSENAREGGKAFNRRFSALVNVLRYVFFSARFFACLCHAILISSVTVFDGKIETKN
jgi:hypothetical protein